MLHLLCFLFFFFNDTATTEIYTLSLHDALPICTSAARPRPRPRPRARAACRHAGAGYSRSRFAADRDSRRLRGECTRDRKSTRLNSSHSQISYAVFCLKKKKTKDEANNTTDYHD